MKYLWILFTLLALQLFGTDQEQVTLESKEGLQISLSKAAICSSRLLNNFFEYDDSNKVITFTNVGHYSLKKTKSLLLTINSLRDLHKELYQLYNSKAVCPEKEVDNLIFTALFNSMKTYLIYEIKDILLVANYLDIPLLTNSAAACFGRWLFLNNDWQLLDPLFEQIPSCVKKHTLVQLFKKAPFVCRDLLNKCVRLGHALSSDQNKPLSFEQCLVCIQEINDRDPIIPHQKFALSTEVKKALKEKPPSLNSDIIEGGVLPFIDLFFNEQHAIKKKITNHIDCINYLERALNAKDVRVVKHVIKKIKRFNLLKMLVQERILDKKTWLMIAVRNSDLKTVQFFMQTLEIAGCLDEQLKIKDAKQLTVYMHSALSDNIETVTYLTFKLNSLGILSQQLEEQDYHGISIKKWALEGSSEVKKYLCRVIELDLNN